MKWVKVRDKLMLGPHYKIERFGISFLLVCFILFIFMLMGIRYKVIADNELITNQAVYTEKFVTSRSDVSGKVVNVYNNADRTRSFVLCKFDDIAKVSLNAKNYQAFLTGANIKGNSLDLKSSPTGSIYVFGTTGYFGIYLVDYGGFPKQVLSLTIRANSEIVPVEGDGRMVDDDASFAEFDQFRILFNPGAQKATKVDALESGKLNILDLFNETVIDSQEKEKKEAIDKQMKLMQTDLTKIDEYETRLASIELDGVSVIVPDRPISIRGDEVVVEDEGTKQEHLDLRADYTFPRGWRFDWYNNKISEKGYIADIIEPNMTYSEYVASIGAEADEGASELGIKDIVWFMSNGETFTDFMAKFSTDSISNETLDSMNQAINELTEAWKEYYDHKTEYQRKLLGDLIQLDLQANSMERNYTVNNAEEVLLLY